MRKTGFRLLAAVALLVGHAYAQTTVTITPTTVGVHIGTYWQFSARASSGGVTWSVALPAGTGSPGSISTGGRYTPPNARPSATVTVTATSIVTPTVSASAIVTILNPFPMLASTSPANVPVGAFSLALNGSGYVPGAQVVFGGVALPTTYVSATKLTATGTSTKAQKGTYVPLTVTNPDPGAASSQDVVSVLVGIESGALRTPFNVAARFLEQAAFGPDAATVPHVQAIGLSGYLAEQFAAPISPYPDPSMTGYGINQIQSRFFTNAVHGRDQLRQRVAFALQQIFVASAVDESHPYQLVPYLQVFQNDAFGNYLTLMHDVTLNVAMGEYLDMRNNDKADPIRGTKANENYARELMQLFSLGVSLLNPDGTPQLDGSANPIPTYSQFQVAEFSRVYTGWTYPVKPNATPQKHNPAYYIGNMVAYETNHDTGSKTLLNGLVLPAGQTAEQDLSDALNNIFNHPNAGPFVSKILIQHLVTSNPTPAYVRRVAAVFNNNGANVRGDLRAVVRAILLDAEARQGDNGPAVAPDTSGHLREPGFVIPAILRGVGALVNDTNNLPSQASLLGQVIFAPPTVFNYYAPGYQVPAQFTPGLAAGVNLTGPEFQLHSPSEAIGRANLVNTLLYGNLGAGTAMDLTRFSSLSSNPSALVDAVSKAYCYGQMPAAMQTQILSAIRGTTGSLAQAQAALYLTASSGYYNVEH